MARHVHVYLHGRTADQFEESKHPRDKNGKFGSGGGDDELVVVRKADHGKTYSIGNPNPRGPTDTPRHHAEAIAARQKREGKSDYARAREAEHDDRKDADYAQRLKAAKERAAKAAAKKKPAREPKPKAEPKQRAPAKTQEQKDAESRVSKRRAAAAAAGRGDTALAKQLLAQIRKVDSEIEREERRR